MSEKTKEVVDTTKPKKTRLLGVDAGTMNLVLAEQTNEGKVEFSTIRNMYLQLDKSQLTMAELSNIDYVESEESIYIIGEDAYKFANMFGQQVKRPMSKGLISPSEIDGIDVLTLIIKQLVGKSFGGHVVYCVPAPSIDMTNNILYHEGVFKRIFTELGYTAESFNEAMAIIYSQCRENKFTGLAFSFGAGMVNCLSGNTKIRLLDGQIKTIKELTDLYSKGEEFWVYSCREDGTIIPGKAHHPRKIKTATKVVRIELDDGTVEECTLDHLWMMRDGSYKEAKDLQINDSLMPLRLRISEKKCPIVGYYQYYDNVTKGWKFVHRMVVESQTKIPFNYRVHHWNFNKLDNTPSNLVETVLNWNHKVKKIEIVEKECDVYDLTVDEYHNFALASGVFVHNCALSYKSVPIITFSVARAGDWIDEQAAMSLGTVSNRITAIKEKNTDLTNFSVGSKKERRIREAVTYYYREVIRYCLERVKEKLEQASGNLELPESVPIIVSGGTSLAKGFLPLFKEVLAEYSDFPINVSEVKHASDPMTAVAEGLLIRALMTQKNTEEIVNKLKI